MRWVRTNEHQELRLALEHQQEIDAHLEPRQTSHRAPVTVNAPPRAVEVNYGLRSSTSKGSMRTSNRARQAIVRR